MKVHKLFPLVVYQGDVECHEDLKRENLESLKSYWFDGYSNESPEFSGKIFLHKNPYYQVFFNELKYHIDEYFKVLNVDYTKLSYHVIKAWSGCHYSGTPQLKPHNHNEANLSFVYYVKTDESSDKLCITQNDNRNESVGGLFEPSKQRNLITGFNGYNCDNYTITPKEGTVVIFPSKTIHSTQQIAIRKNERIVIPGDIRITLKKDHFDYCQASTHPSQWLELGK